VWWLVGGTEEEGTISCGICHDCAVLAIVCSFCYTCRLAEPPAPYLCMLVLCAS